MSILRREIYRDVNMESAIVSKLKILSKISLMENFKEVLIMKVIIFLKLTCKEKAACKKKNAGKNFVHSQKKGRIKCKKMCLILEPKYC